MVIGAVDALLAVAAGHVHAAGVLRGPGHFAARQRQRRPRDPLARILGLRSRAVVDALLDREFGQALAARLAQGPTAAYRAVKTVLATADTDTLEQTLALEARLQTELGKTADHREAVEAFLAKRTPTFTGR